LVHAAEAVLDREGTAGVTVRAVAAEAGVSPMGVYTRFENKDGLLVALAIRAFDDLAVAIDVPTDVAPLDRLRRACRGYRGFALAHPARYSLIFSVGSPAADPASPATERGRAVFAVLIDMVREATATAPAIDPVEAAQALWNAMHGAVTIELARVGQTADAAASFDQTIELVVAGLRAGRR
jgi:AcrR family transcriptional regulator